MIKMGLVGFGKIAADEHVPAIARTEGAALIAVASRNAQCARANNYPDLAAMLAGEPALDAIILCQPPQARYEAARMALTAGKHVFLEKPPGATLSEVEALIALANAQGVTLFASWHSRWSQPVAALKAWVAVNTLRRVTITWKEDVRRWHPGQDWIWEAGGFGVFDPGINALSILTEVVQERIRLTGATLEIPSNRAAPIAVEMAMETASGAPVSATFDWRQTGKQTWEILIEAENGGTLFSQGGDDAATAKTSEDSSLAPEYRAMYRHFVALVRAGKSDVDLTPLQLVADAWLCGHLVPADPFEDG
jgi:D-galactose 1-dehydrogenase